MDQGNFSYFALPNRPSQAKELAVDTEGNPVRRRQSHRKSRSGCATCKQRKVKCDETQPACLNCTRRNIQCSFKAPLRPTGRHSGQRNRDALISQLPRLGKSPLDILQSLTTNRSGGCHQYSLQKLVNHVDEFEEVETASTGLTCTVVEFVPRMNASERVLLQHFETSTSQNLALSRTIWRTKVLKNAFQCDYLMSAVLLVAAAHINSNLPAGHTGRRDTLQNFSRALSGLRSALTTEMTIGNFETITSCTLLLIHYSWACMEHDLETDIDIAMSFRQIFDHFHGLKDCLVIAQDVFVQTYWAKTLLYSPKIKLERVLMESHDMAEKLEDVFLHCLYCGLGTKKPANASNDNINALSRLIPPLSIILVTLPNFESSEVVPDIHRYLFTWPPLCTKGFVLQVSEGNPASLTILLYYYAAILRTYSEKVWWMRDGAKFMFHELKSKLSGYCDRCVEIPLGLFTRPEDYQFVPPTFRMGASRMQSDQEEDLAKCFV